MTKQTVSVIILNWNGGTLVEECVEAVCRQSYNPVEIIIVDNASTDGSLERLLSIHQNIDFIVNDVNEGFSKAINRGIKRASGAYVLPLNLDVIMENDFIAEMVKALESGERVGSVSGKLLRLTSKEDVPVIDSTGHIICRNRYALNRGEDEPDSGQYDDLKDIFGTCGAAPLYRRAMLDDIAINGEVFDEDFYIMLEDVDIDWRARLRGWDSRYAPASVARHFRSVSGVSKSRVLQRHYYKNRHLLMLKNDRFGQMLTAAPGIMLMNLMLTIDILFTAPAAMFLGWWDIFRLGPRIWRKRRAIMSRRKADVKQWFQPYDYADVRRKIHLA